MTTNQISHSLERVRSELERCSTLLAGLVVQEERVANPVAAQRVVSEPLERPYCESDLALDSLEEIPTQTLQEWLDYLGEIHEQVQAQLQEEPAPTLLLNRQPKL